MSAAFTNPTSGKIDQQRKILEELERKQKLAKAAAGDPTTNTANTEKPVSGSGAAGSSPSSSAGGNAVLTAQDLHLTPVQRQAIDQANKNSFAFFIPQDSAFGNVILPVIPRFPPN